jgi:arylsulfatase A-like enzyme
MWRRLEDRGERDDTLIIFMSDNGYSLGEHRIIAKGSPYAPVVGVPFYLIWKDRIEPGSSDAIVANIDIAPTIYDALEVEVDYEPDGQSVLDDSERRWLYMEGSANRPWAAYLDDRRHYIRWRRPRWVELYDRELDPWQLDARRKAKPRIARLLDEASTCEGAECP